jgi:hypothetical protein
MRGEWIYFRDVMVKMCNCDCNSFVFNMEVVFHNCCLYG